MKRKTKREKEFKTIRKMYKNESDAQICMMNGMTGVINGIKDTICSASYFFLLQ